MTYRTFRATDHYDGTNFQANRRDLKNNVINQQNIFDLIVETGITSRSNLTLDIPYLNSSWSTPRPLGSAVQQPGPRFKEKASGLGDISLIWKTWLLSPAKSGHDGNVVLGIGMKLPTGRAGVKNVLPDFGGNNPQPRTVDQSIQPGDGGLGFPLTVEAYRPIGQVTVFFTANYLVSPRDTNGVASGLAPTLPSPSIGVFSVPDQFLYRFGVGGPVPGVKGLHASISWRKEGVPQKDLIGGSHGFRRPGFSTSVEPSVTFEQGGTSYSLSVPITRTRNSQSLKSDGTEVPSSATFAKYQILFNISRRISLH